MQKEQELFSQSGNVDGGYDLSFATPTNVDLFSFPMSGPATAPAYMNGKSFWDSSNNMTNMTMDFSGDPFGINGAEWTGNFLPQHQMNTPVVHQSNPQLGRRERPLLAKPPTTNIPAIQSGITFDFGMAALSEDPFTMPPTNSAINPQNLFCFSNLSPPMSSNTVFGTSAIQANSHSGMRSQPNLLSPIVIPRPQSSQSGRSDSGHMRRPMSPLKSSRPDVHRTTSDNLYRPPALKPAASSNNNAQPPSNFAGKGRYSSGTGSAATGGKLSSAKQDGRTNLQAIPEKEKRFNSRTAVTFSIDAHGRARTETVILEPEHSTRPRSSNLRILGQESSSRSDSSTDEEVIVVPKRNPSFAQKDRNSPLNMPKMARFNTSIKQYPRSRTGERKLSAGNVKTLSTGGLALNDESEDEAIDTARRSPGDASKALRRVMENRRRSVSGITSMPPSTNTQTIRIQSQPSHGNSDRNGERHYSRKTYASSSNTAYSASTPKTLTDLDNDVEMCDTPSTIASCNENTRCVCQKRHRQGDECMIQCESCEHWQHSTCVKIDPRELPKVYICAFCAQTPNMKSGRTRDQQREELETVLPDKDCPSGGRSTWTGWV